MEIKIFKDVASKVDSSPLQKIAGGFEFTEGPAWHPDGFLLFSDIPANKIYKWSEADGTELYINNSGTDGTLLKHGSKMLGSNAIVIDKVKRLWVCQHGNHGIARSNDTGELIPWLREFDARPFNSPNDLLLHSNGALYFTDPPYGLENEMLWPHLYQPHAGVYLVRNEVCELVSTQLRYPNGLCFSSDERILYVSSNHPDEPYILQFALDEDGDVTGQSIFMQQNSDGMTTDAAGNLYLSTEEGLLIVSPAGVRLALVKLGDVPTNVCWGGTSGADLFITARSLVYKIEGLRNKIPFR